MSDSTMSGIAISRYFAAPPETVYRAFIDPQQLAQWFGPLAFHVPLESVDVDMRPGGHWNMTMQGHLDERMTSPVNATISEVVENRLIVGYELAEGIPDIPDGTRLTLSIEFLPEGDGTRLELRQGPFPEGPQEMATIGWGQSFGKLDALLATPAHFRSMNEQV